jgi:integrase
VPGPRSNTAVVQMCFPNETGGPMCVHNFRSRVFYKLIEKADVPRFRFHGIRHTCASLLPAQGESLHYVKEQMGQADLPNALEKTL